MSEDTASNAPTPLLLQATGSADASAQHTLQGKIGTIELVMTVLAFSAPIVVVAAFAPFVIIYDGAGAPFAYVVGAVLLLLFAVGYTAMSRYIPNAGAFYAYITAGLGRLFGLGASFFAMLGYILMAVGTVAFFGVAASALVVDVLGGPNIAWQYYSAACLLGTGVLGYFRIDVSAKVLLIAMSAEVAIVLLFDSAVFGKGGPEARSLTPLGWGAFSSGSVGLAVLFAATSFLGFEATAVFREETKDPDRTVPRATYVAVICIGLFYIVSVWALVTAYGASGAQAEAGKNAVGMFNDAIQSFVGVWARDVVQALVVTSAFACLLSVQNILSRYVYSLGVDEVLPSVLGRTHPKHGSPSIASVTVSAVLLGTLLANVGSDPAHLYGQLAGAGGFAILVLMFLTGVSVVVYFRRRPNTGVSLWHRLIAPSVSAISMAGVLYLAAANFTTMTGGSMGSAIALQAILWGTYVVGILVALAYRYKRPEVFMRIGRQQA
ncbi:APC family permease [Streptomyces sp. NPDC051322]|uniref:APC family permease n=1 Tax=Streptomyces sp. NPDC051322 TaxID=3154645 RepID=UPI00344DFED3